MLLAVNMIVRNEAQNLPDALRSVREVADEVVIYDTGSTDDTVAVARAAGARVVEGYWDDDFARARNEALAATRATWVMWLDADERWVGDARAVRALLRKAGPQDCFSALVRNRGSHTRSGDSTFRRMHLFRRSGTAWSRAIHEIPQGPALQRLRNLGESFCVVEHLGYTDAATLERKLERNAQIAQREMDRLAVSGVDDPEVLAPALYNFAKSVMSVGRTEQGVQALEILRASMRSSWFYGPATDLLAQASLEAGRHQAVVVLCRELRASGVDDGYCDFLHARALEGMGRVDEALALLRGIESLTDAAGITLDLGRVLELRARLAAHLGFVDEALDCLSRSMCEYGRVAGRGDWLLQLRLGRPFEALAEPLRRLGGPHLPAVGRELESLGEEGRHLARALAA